MNLPKRKRYIRSLLRYGRPVFTPSGCPDRTPDSPCRLIGNGSWRRKPKNVKGKRRLSPVRVQRYLCKTHHRHLSFLPSELLPRLHYPALIVNQAVWKHLGLPVDRNLKKPHWKSVKRWVDRVTQNLEKIRGNVLKRIGHGSDLNETEVEALYVRNTSTPLMQVWNLLRAASELLSEGRMPYHYVAYG